MATPKRRNNKGGGGPMWAAARIEKGAPLAIAANQYVLAYGKDLVSHPDPEGTPWLSARREHVRSVMLRAFARPRKGGDN